MSIAIIGGTGLNTLEGFHQEDSRMLVTPYGEPSSGLLQGKLGGKALVFLPRHGHPHRIPPHRINYRANIDALKQIGVRSILAVNAVGGLHSELGPARIAIPGQIIDYTYDREHTYYDGSSDLLEHVDFTYPYSEHLRQILISSAREQKIPVLEHGVYAATQGPRLESAAEIARIKQDGGDMVGMTGMPEAALAREAGLDYACIALSVNWCAGMTQELITMEEIGKAIEEGMGQVRAILSSAVQAIDT